LAPGAVDALMKMREAGVLLAVVSNFDTRLRQVRHAEQNLALASEQIYISEKRGGSVVCIDIFYII